MEVTWAGLYVGLLGSVGGAGVRRGIQQRRRHGDEYHYSRHNMAAESVSLHLLQHRDSESNQVLCPEISDETE